MYTIYENCNIYNRDICFVCDQETGKTFTVYENHDPDTLKSMCIKCCYKNGLKSQIGQYESPKNWLMHRLTNQSLLEIEQKTTILDVSVSKNECCHHSMHQINSTNPLVTLSYNNNMVRVCLSCLKKSDMKLLYQRTLVHTPSELRMSTFKKEIMDHLIDLGKFISEQPPKEDIIERVDNLYTHIKSA